MFAALLSTFPNCVSTHMFCMCINSIIKGEMLVAPTYSYSIVTHDNAGVVQKTGVNQFHSV